MPLVPRTADDATNDRSWPYAIRLNTWSTIIICVFATVLAACWVVARTARYNSESSNSTVTSAINESQTNFYLGDTEYTETDTSGSRRSSAKTTFGNVLGWTDL